MAEYQDRFPTGRKAPEVINVVISGSKDSKILYKITPKGHIIPFKVLKNAFPFDYGSIPQAMGDTSEPLHAMVLSHEPSLPKSIAQARPIGLVKVFTGEIQFYYVICVGLHDGQYSKKTLFSELPDTVKRKIERWIGATERLKYKHIKLSWEDEGKARDAIQHCRRVHAKLAYITR